jgi:DNA-binding response OmpR family regulator
MKKSPFVLIVDDDRAWAEGVADLFVAYGYETEIVANGRLAVERARRADFDIAFLDAEMSGVDGFSEIRKLKPQARIVMMAGADAPLAFERMLEIVETAA